MYRLSAKQKTILAKKIRQYKNLHFPGKGGGMRLADEVGVPPQTVSNWLSGSRQPTFTQLYRLAIAFHVSPLELCGIARTNTLSRKDTELSLLRDILAMMEQSGSGAVKSQVTAKAMNDIKDLIERMVPELRKKPKGG